MNFVQRILRHFRPGSDEYQEAVEEDRNLDRVRIDAHVAELKKSAREFTKASGAFVNAAELLVKDVWGESGSKGRGKKSTPRVKASK